MRYFYCEAIPDKGERTSLSKQEFRHLSQVVRIRVGEKIGLLDGNGTLAQGILKDKNGDIEVADRRVMPKACPTFHLAVAPPRRNQMDQILRQCSEIGVDHILPIQTDRSVALPEKKNTLERWDTLLVEGCKQSINPFFPTIEEMKSLEEALASFNDPETIVFYGKVPTNEDSPTACFDTLTTYRRREAPPANIVWLIGPEGGFTEAEESMMLDSGCVPLILSHLTMRVETAAIVGAGLLKAAFYTKP